MEPASKHNLLRSDDSQDGASNFLEDVTDVNLVLDPIVRFSGSAVTATSIESFDVPALLLDKVNNGIDTVVWDSKESKAFRSSFFC